MSCERSFTFTEANPFECLKETCVEPLVMIVRFEYDCPPTERKSKWSSARALLAQTSERHNPAPAQHIRKVRAKPFCARSTTSTIGSPNNGMKPFFPLYPLWIGYFRRQVVNRDRKSTRL